MENYTKSRSECKDPRVQGGEGIIRVTPQAKISKVVQQALEQLQGASSKVILVGYGNASTKTVTCAEIAKRRLVGIHQLNEIFLVAVDDIWEPKASAEEGLDAMRVSKDVPCIQITLSLAPLDRRLPGYQAPLPIDQVCPEEEIQDEEDEGGASAE